MDPEYAKKLEYRVVECADARKFESACWNVATLYIKRKSPVFKHAKNLQGTMVRHLAALIKASTKDLFPDKEIGVKKLEEYQQDLTWEKIKDFKEYIVPRPLE